MSEINDIDKNEKSRKNVNSSNGHIEIRGNYNDQLGGIDKEDILDVMGCKTRRDIINLLREEPMFVSEISNELDIGQKAIIAHLRAMEDIGILNSSYKKILSTSIESVMPSGHLILCRPLLLLPPIPPSIRVFSNESALRMRWPKYLSFSFSIIPSKDSIIGHQMHPQLSETDEPKIITLCSRC